MQVWADCWGVGVRVTDERLNHVLDHPEMAGQQARIAETLAAPDVVVQSVSDPEARLYHRFYPTSAVGASTCASW